VTLFEDRAQVVREATISLATGFHRVVVEGVSPLALDRSLVARPDPGLKVHELRVERRWHLSEQSRPPAAQALIAQAERLVDALEVARGELELLLHSESQAEALLGLSLAAVNRALPHARTFDPGWTVDLEAALANLTAVGEAHLDARLRVDGLRLELAAMQTRLATDWRIDHALRGDLVVDLTVSEPGGSLALEYHVPCAIWRPIYRATLDPTRPEVAVACEAAIWQATGEDWRDVALTFSTARPSKRATPPLLTEDPLRLTRKVDKKIVAETREQAIANTGEGVATTERLQGVDDGGEVRVLAAATLATIASDGRMQRVPIATFKAPAELDRVARPEKSTLVHMRTRQANLAPHPLLAGPVELIGESGYVGTTSLGFIAPNERFVLGWGGDEALRIRREHHETRDTSRISGKQVITRTVGLALSNLGRETVRFRVEERIPVSELAEVEVAIDSKLTQPPATADRDGIVAWTVELGPLAHKSISLTYQVTASSEVVI
jgi:uncharacterized protein (TIGR02231 family)